MKRLFSKLPYGIILILLTSFFSNKLEAQAGVTNIDIDGCCATFTIQFNSTGNDWIFYPDYPNTTPVYTGQAEAAPITIEHCFEENGTYQYWFNQLPFNGNSGFYDIEDCRDNPPIDCSTTECTCELTFEVTNATGDFILELAPLATFEACPVITEEGVYTVTIDGQNAGAAITYILAYTPLGGSSIDLVLEGCGISYSANMNAGNSVAYFDVDVCEDPVGCETIEEECDNVSFEYCCETGILTSTFTGPITYVKYHNTSTWDNEWICSPWGNAPDGASCTGSIETFLDPNETWGLEISGGGCSSGEVIHFNVNCGDEGGSERENGITGEKTWGNPSNVSVYPNPAKDFITIQNVIGVNQQVEMLNANGQRVMIRDLQEGSSDIDISTVVPGVYFLRVNDVTSGAVIHSEKIVILN